MTQSNRDAIDSALKSVIDPEVGVNVQDLGLIYEVALTDDETEMRVRMTMTSPACPMGSLITDEVEQALKRHLPALQRVEVQLVWNPPWTPDRMSDAAREQLGWKNESQTTR